MEFTSMKQLTKHFKNLGFFIFQRTQNSITMYVPVIPKDSYLDLDSEEVTLSGETPQEIYDNFLKWVYDKKKWVENRRLVMFDYSANPFDFDLAEELLNLGFKYVEVENEDTNFVEVLCKYCYVDRSGTFQFDGEIYLDDIGDKFMTLEHIKNWIKENTQFRATKNRLYV